MVNTCHSKVKHCTTALKIFNFKQKGMNTIFNYIFVNKLNPNFIDLCLRNLDYAMFHILFHLRLRT